MTSMDSKASSRIWKTTDGSFLDDNDRFLFFSTERFVRDICLGHSCLICGADPKQKLFNDEHVIPQWILHKYDLYNRQMTLSNGTKLPYRQNTVPCCAECNGFLGRSLEEPMLELMTNGFDAFSAGLQDAIPIVFRLLCLTVFKNHYRDRLLRMDRDRRAPDVKLGDQYTWDELHHMHTMARSTYSGADIESDVQGSLLIFQVKKTDLEETFDYVDLYPAQAVLLRVEDIGIVSVLNDSCGASQVFRNSGLADRIAGGSISNVQLREILAHLATINMHLKERPRYRTEVNGDAGTCTIRVTLPPQLEVDESAEDDFGSVMETACGELIRASTVNSEEVLEHVRKGTYTFLFKEDGTFNDQCLVVMPPIGNSS